MAERRENGMGTVYQRPNGTWTGRIYEGKNDKGKASYRYISGKTEAEVKRLLREEYKKQSTVFKQNVTVGDYMTDWLETYKRGSLKRSSYDRLENVLRVHIKPELGMIRLQKLTAKDIQTFLNGMMKEGYAYLTIKKAFDYLNSCLEFAVDNDDISKNPMRLAKMPDKALFQQKEIRFFTEEEANLITEESARCYNTGSPVYIYGDAFVLILNTGLRIGEAIGLEKRDWDPVKKTIHIRRNVQSVKKRDENGQRCGGYELVTNTTKTYSGDRIIPLNETATAALERLCKQHPNASKVICSQKGDPIPPERMERTFYRLLKNAGLSKTGVHSLRHTFASFLFAKGVDVKTISKLLGHANIQITLNTYVHLLNNPEYDAVGKLDAIF